LIQYRSFPRTGGFIVIVFRAAAAASTTDTADDDTDRRRWGANRAIFQGTDENTYGGRGALTISL